MTGRKVLFALALLAALGARAQGYSARYEPQTVSIPDVVTSRNTMPPGAFYDGGYGRSPSPLW